MNKLLLNIEDTHMNFYLADAYHQNDIVFNVTISLQLTDAVNKLTSCTFEFDK